MTKQFNELCNISNNISALYIEDDNNLLQTTQAMLNNIFHTVHTATNGKEGLEKYQEYYQQYDTYFDIIITDIKMPIMNGVELSKKIKKINSKQLIIVTSAYDDSKCLIDFINLGIIKFIKKPFTLNNVITILSDVIKELKSDYNKQDVTLSQEYTWNAQNKKLLKNNDEIKLTNNEITIVDLLINNQGQLFSSDDFDYILQKDTLNKELSLHSIKAIIKRLRQKLPENIIENIYGQGYRINLDTQKRKAKN